VAVATFGRRLCRAIIVRMSPPSRALAALCALVAAVCVPVMAAGPAAATDDPYWKQQWAPVKIGAPAAWTVTVGAGVKIGIVDSGVDLNHQDLQEGKIAANASCIGTSGNPAACVAGGGQDIAGHGTHVAGIAAANKDNGVGIAGIAPGAQLVVARVFQNDSADLADVEAGIRWVVDQGARVVNLSLGENVVLGGLLGGSASLGPVLNEVWARGAIPVVASGNAQFLSGSASYANVNAVVVGATGPDDEIASYSVPTGSAKWALVAPGGNGADQREIISTYWQPGMANQYGYLQGTSMATPHVSASLALLLAAGLGQQRAVDTLLATANRAVACGTGCAGRLDLAAAMAASGAVGATTTTTTTAPTTAPTTAAISAPNAAPTTPGGTGPRVATGRPPTTGAAVTTTVTPAPGTTLPPETGSTTTATTTTAVPPTDEPLKVASTSTGSGDDDVAVPGAVAAVLLLVVVAGAVAVRRRATPG